VPPLSGKPRHEWCGEVADDSIVRAFRHHGFAARSLLMVSDVGSSLKGHQVISLPPIPHFAKTAFNRFRDHSDRTPHKAMSARRNGFPCQISRQETLLLTPPNFSSQSADMEHPRLCRNAGDDGQGASASLRRGSAQRSRALGQRCNWCN
jgi:hypothetical protein